MLVAVVMLFVVGAMAALSIDVVTIYTARSEAQLAADGAALAGARVLANSGATSDTTGLSMPNAQPLAKAVAIQVAQNSLVGGRDLVYANGEVTIGFGGTAISPCNVTNPCITVRVQRTDLPTFFARIWGSKQVTVGASATAEAYNPSGANALAGTTTPVAPICVKPWLLPNIDPSSPANPIFVTTTGAIATTATGLLGWTSSNPTTGVPMSLVCPLGDCSGTLSPLVWEYYPGDPTYFPAPTQSIPTCTPAMNTGYEKSIAGCIQTPIACNSQVNFDASNYGNNRNREMARAVNCLTHATAAGGGDMVDITAGTNPPFQFIAGDNNPIPGLAGSDVMVSDSLVTVPVFDSVTGTSPTNPVTIIGFVQLFLNPDGLEAPTTPPNHGKVNTTVINIAGCGTGAAGQPILGNGASPVAVRLISP